MAPSNAKLLYYPNRSDIFSILLTYGDFDHLSDGEFLNDSIIDFYFKYLEIEKVCRKYILFLIQNNLWCFWQIPKWKRKCLGSETPKFFFFNCFFFKKLQQNASKKDKHKWTKRFNIFDFDYLFIPINQSLHWSLMLVCHPKLFFQSPSPTEEGVSPRLEYLDSLGNRAGKLFSMY
jgi:Ulp1 family protease